MKHLRFAVALLVLFSLLSGCQKQTKSPMPPLHSVQGTVTKDGKPIDEAFVQFVPDSGSEILTVNGRTNADGKFELSTIHAQTNEKKPGAPEGSYTVTIMLSLDPQHQRVEQVTLPDKYQVKPGANDFPLELNPKKK
ncbi:MAG TPA: hypothetical protein VKS79_06130 [Gemmataceae bacterium]|nr:hypothetical protein [Gemmataceae bacterium]